MNKIKYVMRKLVIDRKSIKDFFINEEERRDIKKGKVATLRRILEKGQHFDSPFVICQWRGKKRIIDANHREEAIVQELEENPDFQIEIWVAEYKMPDEATLLEVREFERKIYTRWNSGTKESATDFIQQYFKTIPLGEKMLQQLPISIYSTENKLSLKVVIGAHITSKAQGKFEGGYGVGGEKAVSDLRIIDNNDIKLIRAWYSDYSEIFGKIQKGNIFYRSTPIYAIYRIWYDNRDIPRQQFIDAIRKTFTLKNPIFREMTDHRDRAGCQTFYRFAILRLNDDNPKLHFKSDLELKSVKQNVEKHLIEQIVQI